MLPLEENEEHGYENGGCGGYADGTVDVTFDSLSPVAFVVDKQESTDTEKPGADEPSSPQTGDNGVLRAAGIAALGLGCAAVIGAVSASKKRKG